MLECKLEILFNYSPSEEPARLNMQPQGSQYGKVLASDTMVDFIGKTNTTCIFGWWSLGYLHKARFILLFEKSF